jgi:flavin-dependent dehydrogenase
MTGNIEHFDVAIVGAGPAGSSAAIRLARSGRKVLLVDKAAFPRDKLCGEFVSPECLDHFQELGISERIFSLIPPKLSQTVFHSSSGRSLSIPNEWLSVNNSPSIGVSRLSLDNAFLTEAANAGVDVRVNTSFVDAVVSDGKACGLRLRGPCGNDYEIRSNIAIDATGRGAHLARRFDKSRRPVKPKQVAFKAHIRGAAIAGGTCELFRFDGGYGGTSAVEGEIQDLCFIVDSEKVRAIGNDPFAIFKKTCLKHPRAQEVFRSIEVVSDWLSVPLAGYGSWNVTPFPGVLSIGDAAAFIDPFTGSGIALALESSKIVCRSISERRNNEEIANTYRQMHARNFKWRLRTCAAIRMMSRSQLLTEVIIGALANSELARRLVTRMTRSSSLLDHSMNNA